MPRGKLCRLLQSLRLREVRHVRALMVSGNDESWLQARRFKERSAVSRDIDSGSEVSSSQCSRFRVVSAVKLPMLAGSSLCVFARFKVCRRASVSAALSVAAVMDLCFCTAQLPYSVA